MSGIITKLQGFRRDKDDFYWRMEDLELQGDKRVRLVTFNIDGSVRQVEAGCCSL